MTPPGLGSAPVLSDISQNMPPALRRQSAQPVAKVAGSRRPFIDVKGKGKAVALPTSPKPRSLKHAAATAATPAAPPKKARGRSKGSSNYKDEDIESMLDIAETHLPLGRKGWNTVAHDFAEWAQENGRPERSGESLENKFKQLVRLEKPTGRADCPAWLDHAHAIYAMMEDKATTRALDDDEFADEDAIEISDDNEAVVPVKTQRAAKKIVLVKKEPISPSLTASRRAQTALLPRTTTRNLSNDFLKSISNALDPQMQAAISEERTGRSMLQAQILSLTNQLRDEKALSEIRLNRISDLERIRGDLLRQIDRLEMLSMMGSASTSRSTRASAPSTSTSRSPRVPRTPVDRKRRRRQDIIYADGMATMWVGSDESDHRNDSPSTRRYTHDFSPVPEHPSPQNEAT